MRMHPQPVLVLAAALVLAALMAVGAAGGGKEKLTICHVSAVPPYAQTLTVASSAWKAHRAHGDFAGRCSTVEVRKTVVPSSAPGTFDLEIDGTIYAAGVTDGGTTGARAVEPAAQHTVAESSTADFTSVWSCQDGGTVVAAGDGTSATLPAAVEDGAVVCTFTNTERPTESGTIEIQKIASAVPDAGLFNFVLSNATGTVFSATDKSGGFDSDVLTVPAGTYTLTETAGTGTNLANYTTVLHCFDRTITDRNWQVTLEPGTTGSVPVAVNGQVVCQFTNAHETPSESATSCAAGLAGCTPETVTDADKVVFWDPALGPMYAAFDVSDGHGWYMQGDAGDIFQHFQGTVECTLMSGPNAWFAGTVTSGWAGSDWTGVRFLIEVNDGTPDAIGYFYDRFDPFASLCSSLGVLPVWGQRAVTSGDLWIG